MIETATELRFHYESTRVLLAFFQCYGCDLGYGREREGDYDVTSEVIILDIFLCSFHCDNTRSSWW